MEESGLQELRERVRNQLEISFTAERQSLVATCEQMEVFLLAAVQNSIMEVLKISSRAAGAKFVDYSPYQFICDGAPYEFRVHEGATKNSRPLEIEIRCTDPKRSNFNRKVYKTRVVSLGRITDVHVTTDKTFVREREMIAETARSVLEAGYLWLAEHIKTLLMGEQNTASDNLYSHIRSILPPQIANEIWLYMIADKEGVYVTDIVARERALERASGRLTCANISPIEIVTDFCTRRTDFELTYSKVAISEDLTLEGEFAKAPYIESGVHITEAAIYVSEQHVIQPLVREGKTYLSAAYPSRLRSTVEPILKRERNNFRHIVAHRASAFRRILSGLGNYVSCPDYDFKNWLELKPNIAGIGLNINQIVADLTRRRTSRK